MGAAHGMAIPTIRAHHAWPQDQSRGRNSQATQTYPTTLFCPPTSVKHVKFHLLHSTSSSGLQFTLPLSLWRFCPSPYSCLLQKSFTSTELPAWGKGKDSGQKPLCDIWKQSSAFTCYIQMESGMLWSTEWSGLDEDTQLKFNWGKGKFLASLITAWN